MRVVIDGLPIRGNNSLKIVSEQLLSGWQGLGRGDEVHIVLRSDQRMAVPDGVIVHRLRVGRIPLLSRVYAQSVRLPRICRQVRPDVMLGVIPSTAITPLPCPRAVIAWDFRYRALPGQFRATERWFRWASYAIGFRQADGVVCISGRTKTELRTYHPRRAAEIPVAVASLGADHVDDWPLARRSSPDYAIAFGHFANKNLDLVLHSWAASQRQRQETTLPLQLIGVREEERPLVEAKVAELELAGAVTVSQWLDDDAHHRLFASSSLVVFPSDYEGFGLPAVEAMRLGIPLVVTPDPALLEVTAGHATVVEGEGPAALARAVATARRMSVEARESAVRHTHSFTWESFALRVRTTLGEVSAAAAPARRVWRPASLPTFVGVIAAVVALGGVAAASYDLTSSPAKEPRLAKPSVVATTSTTSGSGTVTARGGAGGGPARGPTGASAKGQTPHSGAAGSGSTPNGTVGSRATSSTVPSLTSGSRGSTGGTKVTVPPVPLSTDLPTTTTTTTPSITVPTATVPPAVCATSTTLAAPLTIPCGAAVTAP